MQSSAEAAAAQLACHVITAPQLLHQLPAAARKQLTSTAVLILITKALQQLTSAAHQPLTRKAASQSSKPLTVLSSSSNNLRQAEGQTTADVRLESSEAAMLALGNLAALLCGERVSKADQVHTDSIHFGASSCPFRVTSALRRMVLLDHLCTCRCIDPPTVRGTCLHLHCGKLQKA